MFCLFQYFICSYKMAEQKNGRFTHFILSLQKKNFISSFQDKNMVTVANLNDFFRLNRLSIVDHKIQDCRHHIYILKSCFKYFSAKNGLKQMNLNTKSNCECISWEHPWVSIECHQRVLNHKNNFFHNVFSLSILEWYFLHTDLPRFKNCPLQGSSDLGRTF